MFVFWKVKVDSAPDQGRQLADLDGEGAVRLKLQIGDRRRAEKVGDGASRL